MARPLLGSFPCARFAAALSSMRFLRAPRTPPNSADGRDSNLRLCGICCGRLLLGMEALLASECVVQARHVPVA
jgi:hypothetical protein